MAIQIDTSLNLLNGLEISGAYLRVDYKVDIFGNKIVYGVFPYISRSEYVKIKESEERNRTSKIIDIESFKTSHVISYDKDSDGENVLQIVHDDLYSYITEDEIYSKIIFDPSTGDPSTMDVVIREKFALPQDTSIVDLN